MFQLENVVSRALAEDVGSGDVTSRSVVAYNEGAEAEILFCESGILAGLPPAREAFILSDSKIEFESDFTDGDSVAQGDVIAMVSGPARSMLTAERVALNFLQRLSGVATATARAVQACCGTRAQIIDTRKTTPGLRYLEKEAVRVGGGKNHRMRLDDAVLIKDNHIAIAGGVGRAIRRARDYVGPTVKIEVETETLQQVAEAVDVGADIIMLDNMSTSAMSQAVQLIDGRALVEASGGMTPETIPQVAACGVDFISMGYLTHSAAPVDISMQVVDTFERRGG